VVARHDEVRFREWGYYSEPGRPRVLIASGFGYGNVGDEAQVGACMSRWRRVAPDAALTMLSPNPPYTAALHGERVEWAPRVAWFRSNSIGPYFDDPWFGPYFRWLRLRLEISARLFRGDLPGLWCTAREARILELIQEHDVVHISGGGFLTGKTRSRLWDHCLLMRMCQLLGKPYFLTGHNIGVFQCGADRRIARMGLRRAESIGLRDRGISERELAAIGVSGSHVESTCDDALFCERLPAEALHARLGEVGLEVGRPWVAANFHYWGQPVSERDGNARRFAEVCDVLIERHGLQVVLIAMTPTDSESNEAVAGHMRQTAGVLPYDPDYRAVRGVIADAALVFTMKHHPIVFAQGEGVPVVCVALDDYYAHKNRGALENTGHAEFMADRDAFDGSGVFEMIDSALARSEEISAAMRDWTSQMRERELEPYRAVVEKLRRERPATRSNAN